MKRLLYVFAAVVLTAVFAGAQSQSSQDTGVSLGDAARAARAKQTPPSPNGKVYTNDNIPTTGSISTTSGNYGGIAPAPSPKPGSKDAAAAKSDDELKAKMADDYKQKVADVKKQISQLKAEIDVMQREDKLRQAAYYGDAGAQMRPENMQKYQEATKKYKDDLQAKQDALDAANQQLENLREEIRKNNLPSSIGE